MAQPESGKAPKSAKGKSKGGFPGEEKKQPGTTGFEEFSRWYPSHGAPPDSDTYLGKLMPGLRPAGLPPVPVQTPDVPKCPFRMVDGVKEFHLYAEQVRHELWPNSWIDLWGYNGVMPGPTIEATVGDRVRIILHNRLPEATTLHFYGGEVDNELDGVPGVTTDPVPPGGTKVYEYTLHQVGTYYYQSHFPLEIGQGMLGFFIIHPKVAYDPPVDRDFAIAFQIWQILPNNTINVPWAGGAQGVTWKTVNGRASPYSTPIVVKHGERVRIRVANFSRMLPHAIHMHGYTFWETAYEGARQPATVWQVRNVTPIHVGQTTEYEFIANNPGDWVLHCHMVEHMLMFNPVANPVGPREREERTVEAYRRDPDRRPPVKFPHTDPGHLVPGHPQSWAKMIDFTEDQIRKLNSRRETRGMRHNWYEDIRGLFTVLRVLPEDIYDLVMHSDKELEPGEVFRAITEGKRRKKKGA